MNEDHVRDEMKTGNILIKEGVLLPEALQIESEPCVPGWRLVKDFDGYGMDREIRKTGWNFFCLTGEIRAFVLGTKEQSMVRRAIKRIVGRLRSTKFNSLEITRLVSKRFLRVTYVSVCVQSRHIQKRLLLFSAGDISEWGRMKRTVIRTIAERITNPNGLASEKTTGQVGVATTPSL